MAAPMSSDSSSEDEESSARFREAVIDTPFVVTKDLVCEDKKVLEKKDVVQTLPSKRPDKEQLQLIDEQQDNLLGTTPGVRKHISKKLTQVIDSNLEFTEKNVVVPVSTLENDNAVKLFSSSSNFLSAKSAITEVKKPVRKRPVSSSSDSSSEDERLAEASVSHDFIMKQKDTPYIACQKPPDVIIKSSTSDKQLTSTSDSNTCTKINTAGESVTPVNNSKTLIDSEQPTDTMVDDAHEQQTKKAKKKRKKHKKEKQET